MDYYAPGFCSSYTKHVDRKFFYLQEVATKKNDHVLERRMEPPHDPTNQAPQQFQQEDPSACQQLNLNGTYRNSNPLQQPTTYPLHHQPILNNHGFYHPLNPSLQQGFPLNNFNPSYHQQSLMYPFNPANYPSSSGFVGSHQQQVFFQPNPFNQQQILQNVHPQPYLQQQPLSKQLPSNTLEEQHTGYLVDALSSSSQKALLSASEQLMVESIKLYQLQNQLYLNQVAHLKDYEYHLLKVSNDLESIKSLHDEVKELKEEISKFARKKNKLLKKANTAHIETNATKIDEDIDEEENIEEDSQLEDTVMKLLNGNHKKISQAMMNTNRHYGITDIQNSSFLLNSIQNSKTNAMRAENTIERGSNVPTITINHQHGTGSNLNGHITEGTNTITDTDRSAITHPAAAAATVSMTSLRIDPPPQTSMTTTSNIASSASKMISTTSNPRNDETLRKVDTHHDASLPAISIANSSLRFTSSTHDDVVESTTNRITSLTTHSVLEKRSRISEASASSSKKKKIIEEIVDVEDQSDSYETKFPLFAKHGPKKLKAFKSPSKKIQIPILLQSQYNGNDTSSNHDVQQDTSTTSKKQHTSTSIATNTTKLDAIQMKKKEEIEKQKKLHMKNRYKDEEYLVLPMPTQPPEEQHEIKEEEVIIEKSPTLHRQVVVDLEREDQDSSSLGDDILYLSLGIGSGSHKKVKQEEPSPLSSRSHTHATNPISTIGSNFSNTCSPPNYTNLTTTRVQPNKPAEAMNTIREKNNNCLTPKQQTSSPPPSPSPLITSSSHLNSEDEEEYSKYFKSPKHKKRHATPGHDCEECRAFYDAAFPNDEKRKNRIIRECARHKNTSAVGHHHHHHYSHKPSPSLHATTLTTTDLSSTSSSKTLSKQPPQQQASFTSNTSPPLLLSAPPTPPHYWDLNSIEETQESHHNTKENTQNEPVTTTTTLSSTRTNQQDANHRTEEEVFSKSY
ncbi:hypothetical protein C9374_011867 [Naegleria lovaniensis]|uniref:DNA endonuclease activator Ctp1 C-terminal domain-containing protein n=1 Tax=Naegleria lovaniensis TaxID=51637 RepID=A0AA88GEL6_NAELO|nr:uncharacterized protein C9374_011867 [Naegleria lovaniensis]KAG2373778.1 hypothetical protein C9374_011867 [Naegleria lovaniensis]